MGPEFFCRDPRASTLVLLRPEKLSEPPVPPFSSLFRSFRHLDSLLKIRYLRGRGKEEERLIRPLVHSSNTHNGWAEAGSQELDSSLPCGYQEPNHLSCLSGYTLAGKWNWEQSQDLNPDILIWDVGFLASIATTRRNTCPIRLMGHLPHMRRLPGML